MFFSIHVGNDDVDRTKYPDFDWSLPGCIESAKLMRGIVSRYVPGATNTVLLQNATVSSVKEALYGVVERAQPGDTVLFSYHGHGLSFNVNASNAPPPEGSGGEASARVVDSRDLVFGLPTTSSGILLWDRMMVATEYSDIISGLPRGIKYINVIDSCDSSGFILSPELLQPLALSIQQKHAKRAGGDGIDLAAVYNFAGNDRIYDLLAGGLDDLSRLKILYFPFIHLSACGPYESMWSERDGTEFGMALDTVLRSSEGHLPSYNEMKSLLTTQLIHQGFPKMHPQLSTTGMYTDDVLDEPFLT